MAILACAGALAIALGYATSGAPNMRDTEIKRVSVADLGAGEARVVSWASRPVIIVRLVATADAEVGAGPDRWRVYVANDPRHGCLLRWSPRAAELRSVCADARYGVDGEPIGATRGPDLRVPRHRVTGEGVVVLGRD